MLSRTANHLYWMARYMERAENMARILDVTSRMCLAPNASKNEARLWIPAIRISGEIDSFQQRYGAASERTVVMHMVFDRKNPSSIFSCLHAARENARAVRGAITTEMWESLNATWLEIKDIDSANLEATGLSDFCERVKSRSHLFRGVTFGTMLHDDAFGFLRLGTFLERADNTARILDVKYHVLLPSPSDVGGAEDYYEWSAILRSVSAFAAYRKIYRETVTAWRVAEILVLRHDMPRSLHACFDEISGILQGLRATHHSESMRIAGELHAKLHFGRIETIFQDGLHQFLVDFIRRNNQLGSEIQKNFLAVPCA